MAATASAQPLALDPPAGGVSSWVLLQVLWRSFFFQAATNYERMQNVGFAYCMAPALKVLYTGADLRAAMARHLEFFNSHPYMSGALIGAAIQMEERVARGELDPSEVQTFKRCMMGPMAAIGDSFFWASLKPFGAAWAIAGVLSGIEWAPLAFLALYNLFHLSLRVFGLRAGHRRGEQVMSQITRFELVRFADRSHYLAGAFLGVGAALLADTAARSEVALGDGLEPVLVSVLTVIFLLCLRRRMVMPTLLYGFAGVCVVFVLGLNALYPLI
jgi:mannose PTS system EIID component